MSNDTSEASIRDGQSDLALLKSKKKFNKTANSAGEMMENE